MAKEECLTQHQMHSFKIINKYLLRKKSFFLLFAMNDSSTKGIPWSHKHAHLEF